MTTNRLFHRTITTISICLITVLILAVPAFGLETQGTPVARPVIQVTATGSTTVAPDQARVSLGVTTTHDNLAQAQNTNSLITNIVIDALQDFGIKSQDIQTSGYNIYPQYDYSEKGDIRVLKGYQVRNEITIIVKDISKVGSLLDVAVKAGANNVDGITFEKADLSAAENEALAKALVRGQEKARVLADAAQMNLGRLININEGYNNSIYMNSPNIYMDQAKGLGSAAVPINPGELRVTSTVTLVYELE